ncbi:MAG: PAS domain S-box protein, partial [Variovorax sp.]
MSAAPAGADRSIFRALFESYPDSLLVVDYAGTIVLPNAPAARLLGYSVEELVGMPVDALVPDAIRPRHAAFREGYARAPHARPMGMQMELAARRKDGSEVIVEIALSPLQDQGLPYVVAAIRDIGTYPRVQQALQRSRYNEHLAQFSRLVVDARDPHTLLGRVPVIASEALRADVAMVFLMESDQHTLRVVGGVGNVPGEELGALVPYRPDAMPGWVLASENPLIVDDYRTERRFEVPQAYLDAGLVSGLAVPVSDRGHVIGALSVRSRQPRHFGDDEARFLMALASLLAASLQRVQSEEALNHAQRLESVGQLTGGIAHDFNNLLTVIQGNLQVLAELPSVAPDGHAQQLVGAAMRATRRGADLTGKLLAFSRRQVLQPTVVEVPRMLEALADMLRRTLDQQIRITVEAPADCPPVLADPVQLESALLNIAINARDAMHAGGSLRFRAELRDALPRELRRELSVPEDDAETYVSIAISDTGTGMSDEVRERALEPFFTTKEPGRGTGLGLSTVYGFVKQSRGAMSIDSKPGHGTVITLYIPRADEALMPADHEPETGAGVPTGLRVLMVEDDSDVRSILGTFLDKLGCDLTTAQSGDQALTLLDAEAAFDLLLTDISLGPGMRGTEVAARAQQRLPQLAILLMSGFSAELLAADRDSPGSWELLPKPCTSQELAAAIGRA